MTQQLLWTGYNSMSVPFPPKEFVYRTPGRPPQDMSASIKKPTTSSFYGGNHMGREPTLQRTVLTCWWLTRILGEHTTFHALTNPACESPCACFRRITGIFFLNHRTSSWRPRTDESTSGSYRRQSGRGRSVPWLGLDRRINSSGLFTDFDIGTVDSFPELDQFISSNDHGESLLYAYDRAQNIKSMLVPYLLRHQITCSYSNKLGHFGGNSQ